MLTYASTIHKAQGLTLPIVAIYFDNMPSHSELYVAMSRVRRADKLYFFGVDAGDVEERFQLYLNGDAIEIMETLSWFFIVNVYNLSVLRCELGVMLFSTSLSFQYWKTGLTNEKVEVDLIPKK